MEDQPDNIPPPPLPGSYPEILFPPFSPEDRERLWRHRHRRGSAADAWWKQHKAPLDLVAERERAVRNGSLAKIEVYFNYDFFRESSEPGAGQRIAEMQSMKGEERPVRSYYPMAYSNLPFELAKIAVGDEEALLEFVHRWGLLDRRHAGSESLDRSRTEDFMEKHGLKTPGDPLWWVWAHVRQVHRLVTLIGKLKEGNEQDLHKALMEIGQERRQSERLPGLDGGVLFQMAGPLDVMIDALWLPLREPVDPQAVHGRMWLDLPVGQSWEITSADHLSGMLREPADEASSAWEFVMRCIDPNLVLARRALGFQVVKTSTGAVVRQVETTLWIKSLVEAIYLHLANYAADASVGVECGHCHRRFRAEKTQGRPRRFCPAPPHYTESPCALTYRKNKLAAKKKKQEEEPNG